MVIMAMRTGGLEAPRPLAEITTEAEEAGGEEEEEVMEDSEAGPSSPTETGTPRVMNIFNLLFNPLMFKENEILF